LLIMPSLVRIIARSPRSAKDRRSRKDVGQVPDGDGRSRAAEVVAGVLDRAAGIGARGCADRLLEECGSLGAALATSPRPPGQIPADEAGTAPHPEAVQRAVLLALRDSGIEGQIIAGTRDLARYLRVRIGWLPTEQIRVLFLGGENRLLRDEAVAEGLRDEVVLPVRRIVHRALDLDARGIILVHNHPSGNAEPSQNDLSATRLLYAVCKPLEILLHDHIVVASGGWTSLRLRGLL
jgi:DNA repair protein RadC